MKLTKLLKGEVKEGHLTLRFDTDFFQLCGGVVFISLYPDQAKWLVRELSEAIDQIEKEPSCQ